MAHNGENSVTPGKRRNSTVYVAKTATGDNNTDLLRYGIQNERSAGETVAVAKGELPRRDSVLQIKNAFEKVVKKTPGSYGGKLRESLTNSKVEDFDKKSTARENSRFVQGNYPSTLEPHSVKSPYSKSQTSCDSVRPEARCEAEEDTTIDNHSAQQPDSKTVRRGSLLMQPASNIRGPLAKAEYLSLNKFNDVKTYSCSKKRPKMTVDELDKRLEASLPVDNVDDVIDDTVDNVDDVTDASCGYEDEGQELGNEFACEFVGAGVKGNRPVLKSSKSIVNKKVSFCLRSTSVFEYPAEPADTGSSPPPPSEPNASESSTHDESELVGDQLNLTSKSLQSSPGCSATGKLGSYQSRILEHCDLSPCYSTQATSSTPSLPVQQQQYFETNDLRQRVNMAQPLFATSCSADDQPSRPWSDIHGNGKSGSELLY